MVWAAPNADNLVRVRRRPADERLMEQMVVGRNGPRKARWMLRKEKGLSGMHQTQYKIQKEYPEDQGAEDAWGGPGSSGRNCLRPNACFSSRRGYYFSGVKVFFADVGLSEDGGCGGVGTRGHLERPDG